ncbi:hypothetical protein Tco_1000006 [Tanacetum coccineum]
MISSCFLFLALALINCLIFSFGFSLNTLSTLPSSSGILTTFSRMELYIQMIDYSLWEIIENGNAPPITKVVERCTSGTNGSVNTTHGATSASTQAIAVNSIKIDNLSNAVICAFFASQPNSPQLNNEDLQHMHPDDLEKMENKVA